ncbi:MAG: AI-2E family transporter [Verrucomicrobia bacterium]|nr:AI-2E family transporter [Verrucomicrobiota bacterium]
MNDHGLTFSDRQRSIISSALTLLGTVVIAVIFIWISKLVIDFFQFFSGVFLPLAVAGILAMMVKPYFDWLKTSTRSNVLALILVVLSALVPILAVGWFFGALILGQIAGLAAAVPVWIQHMSVWFGERMPWLVDAWEQYGVTQRLQGLLSSHGDAITAGAAELGARLVNAGQAIFRSVAGLLGWAVLPVYFIFLVMIPSLPTERYDNLLPFLKQETRQDLVYLAREFVAIIISFFRGQFIIALGQGVLYGIGFAVIGLNYGLLLGLIFGFLNIIPYLGNILGLLCVLPLAYFQEGGGWSLVGGAGIVFVITQCIEAYILTPKIMGNQTGLHPGVIIFAMFFWGTALGGILGMILAIPLTAFLVVFWRLMRTKYMKEWF